MSFLSATQSAIARHGLSLTYSKTSQNGVYNVETGMISTTTTTYTIKTYPKQIIANTYNYPTLIGKEVVMFYLANVGLTFTPELNDVVQYKGADYTVLSYQEHLANGSIILFRILATRN